MTTDTEKALLRFVGALARYFPYKGGEGGDALRARFDEVERAARAYLASLEPKPEPWGTNTRDAVETAIDRSKQPGRWNEPKPEPKRILACDNCGHEMMPGGARICKTCEAKLKPEPKRGVEEILGLWIDRFSAPAVPDHLVCGDLREALRLYREERERVGRIAASIRRTAPDACPPAEIYPTKTNLNLWADELEGRDTVKEER